MYISDSVVVQTSLQNTSVKYRPERTIAGNCKSAKRPTSTDRGRKKKEDEVTKPLWPRLLSTKATLVKSEVRSLKTSRILSLSHPDGFV